MKKYILDLKVTENLRLHTNYVLLKFTTVDGSSLPPMAPGQFAEVRVVLRRDAQRLQVGELAQRVRLAQLELVAARLFLRTQRHHAEAAVRHRGHLSQCAVGVDDSYSR